MAGERGDHLLPLSHLPARTAGGTSLRGWYLEKAVCDIGGESISAGISGTRANTCHCPHLSAWISPLSPLWSLLYTVYHSGLCPARHKAPHGKTEFWFLFGFQNPKRSIAHQIPAPLRPSVKRADYSVHCLQPPCSICHWPAGEKPRTIRRNLITMTENVAEAGLIYQREWQVIYIPETFRISGATLILYNHASIHPAFYPKRDSPVATDNAELVVLGEVVRLAALQKGEQSWLR